MTAAPRAFERRRLILAARLVLWFAAIGVFAVLITAAGNLVGLGR